MKTRIIRGERAEISQYLASCTDNCELTLIVHEKDSVRSEVAVESAAVRNGVPIFPTLAHAQPVTPEIINRLLYEEETA